MTVQTFDPANVLVSQQKDGKLIPSMTNAVLKEVAETSAVMQLGKYVEMGGKQEVVTQIQTDGISAYWVNETEKIKTDKPELTPVTLRAHKIGVILLASREALKYTWERFFEEMKPQIVEAFRQKIDEAGILGLNSPFANSVEKAIKTADTAITGEINYANVLALQDKLYDADVEANGMVSKVQNRSALREARDGNKMSVYDRSANTVDGIQVVDMKSPKFPKGTVYAGDFDHLIYGVPYNITYKISEEGQISTVKNEDGSPVNLFEQEMIALRATMDVAVMVTKDKAFAKITKDNAEIV